MFYLICTVCHKKCEKPISYTLKPINGGIITKACCEECSDKTHEKWIENGWVKTQDDDHIEADKLLIEYIDDDEIKQAFDDIEKMVFLKYLLKK